ncbi:glucose-6-phosphate isomerase [Litorivivens lipolytica]|uniref:Glucose-6-phosphate isomerase n=1 Tax=Litorivivens lipolytica TaxID=1524264 RepID=A0A7W4W6Q2_9GAMM|nr:glucose-6-phosphate isomerase [Litorivivens lipolytica]MBB3047939.1 glucose-6-phosphate isomerase [Litorivivens lipolytica]
MTDLQSLWQRLQQKQQALNGVHMRDQYAADPTRFARYSLQAGELFLDYSKNRIDDETLALLCQLAEASGVAEKRDAMFAGEEINHTEGRAVLHTALRAAPDACVECEGNNVIPQVQAELQRLEHFVTAVRAGSIRGATGELITDVVNIGIGGSDLGPAMVSEALRPYRGNGPNLHFVSNVDPVQMSDTLAELKPQNTLFIIVSKTFATQETMANAALAQDWLLVAFGSRDQMLQHCVAVTSNAQAAGDHGFAQDRTFLFWDWVGGRYSLWSSVGLSIALSVGMGNFRKLLEGAREMDEHFRSAPFSHNMPVLLAVLGVWYRNVWGAGTHAVLPYSQRLSRLPAYLQQLDMESNGKCVKMDGSAVESATGPVIWGEPGTNGQHAFYQLLHQGTDMVPCDILFALEGDTAHVAEHRMLLANAIAQGEALMCGKTDEQLQAELAASSLESESLELLQAHRRFPGNKPSNALVFQSLSPKALGSLIALYEHKVFCQGVIWGINSFDQWGVELGKQLAKGVLEKLNEGAVVGEPASLQDWVLSAR